MDTDLPAREWQPAGFSGRDATLSAPPVPRGLVQRLRLLRRLDAAAAGPLTLVSGGAGFGKTSLLVSWATRLGPRVAWLALEPTDADASTFAGGLAQAVERVEPGRCRSTAALCGGPGEPTAAELGRALANDLACLSAPLVLLIDDSHHLARGDAIDVLDALLARPPARLRLVMAGREEPDLPSLGRLELQGQVARIGERALRFTPPEAERLLGRALERTDPDTAAFVLEMLDGWPAGLRLLRLRVRDADPLRIVDPRATVADIGERLAQEVLDREPPERVAFLERIAVLQRVTPGIAAAVQETGETAARGLLDELARRHLFVALEDPVTATYRVHGLLRGALQARVAVRGGPGAVADLHRRAAAWFADHGQADDAIAHLLEAGDLDAAVGLIGARGIEALSRDDWRAVRRWLRRVPADAIGRYPELAILEGHIQVTEGRRAAAEDRLAEAERLLAREPAGPRRAWLATELAAARCTFAASGGDLATVLPIAAGLMADPDARPTARSFGIMSWTMAMQLAGDADAARAVLAREQDAAAGRDGCYRAYTLLAEVPLAKGEPDARAMADAATAAARAAADAAAARPHAWALTSRAHAQLEMGLAADAAASARAARVAGRGDYALPDVEAAGVLAMALARIGDRAAARATVGAMRRLGGPEGNPLANGLADAAEAGIAHLAGLPPDPAWLAEALGATALHPVRFAPQPAALAAALVLAHEPERAAEALAAVDACLVVARAQHAGWHVARLLPTRALALERTGSRAAALAALREALEIEPGHMTLRFLDHGEPMHRLLEALRDDLAADQSVAAAELRRRTDGVLAAFAPADPDREPERARPTEPPADASALTARERDVLAGIARHLTNEEIAAELFLSRETVKQHASRLYRKLGVGDRRAAARAAADLLQR